MFLWVQNIWNEGGQKDEVDSKKIHGEGFFIVRLCRRWNEFGPHTHKNLGCDYGDKVEGQIGGIEEDEVIQEGGTVN